MKTVSSILVTILITLCIQGCVSTRDISSQFPYSGMMGKKYVLKQSCYIYQTRETGTNLFVGNASVGHFLPEEVSSAYIGKQINKKTIIIGFLPRDSVFTIVGCDEERRPEDLFRLFKAKFGDGPFVGQTLDVSDLTDMTKNPPEFRKALAVPVE